MLQITDVIQSLLATGFGVWNIVLFLQYRKLKKAQAIADTRDVWEEIAHSNNEALLEQNEEIKKLRESVNTFERILLRYHSCRYYDICPVRTELQKYKNDTAAGNNRKFADRAKTNRRPRDRTVQPGDADDTDGRPP